MFRTAKVALAAAALIVAGIGVASPAHAAASVTINSSYVASPSTVSDTSVTFTNNAASPVYIGTPFATGGTNCTASPGSGNCVVPAGGTATFDIKSTTMIPFWTVASNSTIPIGDQSGDGGTLKLSVTYSSGGGGGGGGGGSSSSTTSGSAPAPVAQQFGMPATGTCDEAQPEGLNWSGVADGGWGVSWAQWVNNGNGGAVCTRTLVYSTTQSKWIVN